MMRAVRRKRYFGLVIGIVMLFTSIMCLCSQSANNSLIPESQATQNPPPQFNMTTFTNPNYLSDLVFDNQGNLWAAGSGGVVRWDVTTMEFESYTVEDGLINLDIEEIILSSDGTVWTNSQLGLSHFEDGIWSGYSKIQNESLLGINIIAPAPDGNIFIGELGGYRLLDIDAWSLSPINRELDISHVNDLLVLSDDSILAGTSFGVYRVFESEMIEYSQEDGLIFDNVVTVWQSADETIWFGTPRGVSRFAGESWQTYTTEDGLVNNDVQAIFSTPDGMVWFGTSAGLSSFDGESWQSYTTEEGLANNHVTSITSDPEGRVCLSTWGGGVSCFDGVVWQTYAVPDVLPSKLVSDVVVDASGDVWIGMEDQGLAKYDGEAWIRFTAVDTLLSDRIFDLAFGPDGSLWVATYKGLNRYDGENWTSFTRDDGLADNRITKIAIDDQGNVWLAHMIGYGVSYYDGVDWKIISEADGLPSKNVYDISAVPDGTVWFATARGFSQYDGNSFTNLMKYADEEEGELSVVTAIEAMPDGTVWLGDGRHMIYFDGETLSYHSVRDAAVSIAISLLVPPPFGFILAALNQSKVSDILVTPDQDVWFATDGAGLFLFDGEDWNNYTIREGMPSNYLNSLSLSSDGSLWVGTSNGVVRLERLE